ncbi:hypothetical protein [Chromobacterium sp. ATCC 53434]|uniref:hypothetical protein n=1 Tax=Chromobacterium sp. (strain ATCC 53434 / SC 14030) TaxID=2059672 RepID=UPI0013051CE7|nr:hypothetical protein [Chromobacterium sp. ATCC 53434]
MISGIKFCLAADAGLMAALSRRALRINGFKSRRAPALHACLAGMARRTCLSIYLSKVSTQRKTRSIKAPVSIAGKGDGCAESMRRPRRVSPTRADDAFPPRPLAGQPHLTAAGPASHF